MKDPGRFTYAPDGTAIRRCVRCRQPITAHAPDCADVRSPLLITRDAVRVAEVARIRDRACEACGFVVCTPACEAETAHALAKIEANKAAAAERADADRQAFRAIEAAKRAAPEDEIAEELRALDRVISRSPEYRQPPPAPTAPDHVLTFAYPIVPAGAEIRMTIRPHWIFVPRRLCVLRAAACFEILDVRVGCYSLTVGPVAAAIYSIPMQRFSPTLSHPRPAHIGQDVEIIARNIARRPEAFEAVLWGPGLQPDRE